MILTSINNLKITMKTESKKDVKKVICGNLASIDFFVAIRQIFSLSLLTENKKIDVVLTDPPYGMKLDTDYSNLKSKMNNHNDLTGNKYEKVIGDNEDFNPKLIDTIFNNFGYAKEMFIFGADYFAELIPNRNDGSWLVWDKRANKNGTIEDDEQSDKMFGSCFELCWSKQKHKREIARIKWAGLFGLEKEFDSKRYHPTQKPIDLIKWILLKYTNKNDTIIDLYGGSGSTLLTCEMYNRICYMMELDEHYCDIIIHRWEKLTKEKAILINGQKTL